MDKDWEALVERVAREMWQGKRKGAIDPAMTKRHAQELMKAVVEGLGYGYGDDLSPKQAQTLIELQTNVYHFSGAKNWNQLKEFSALLTDKSGDAKSFNQFLKAVKSIDETYNQTYLQAEYNHAIASAQMTSKWQQFEQEADALPYLQYVAVMDGRTREEHRKLHDIVRPVKDAFWKTYYPPNGWNCRCSVLQLDEDDAEGKQNEPLPDKLPPVHPMFRNNVGINKEVFSRSHPYFATLPAAVMQQVINQSEQAQKLKTHRLSVLLLDRDKQFDLHHTEGKTGRVYIHKLVDRNSSSFRDELQVAMDKARQGIAVEMLPELFTEEQLFFYSKIFPKNKKQPKQPDYRYPGTADYADMKKPVSFSESALSDNIRKAAKQADHAIVVLASKNLSWKRMKEIVVGRMKTHLKLQSVEIITGNVRKTYTRKKLGV